MLIRRTINLLICLLLGLLPLTATAEETVYEHNNNNGLHAIVNVPDAPGNYAVVVIAPGGEYHMGLPIIQSLANELAEQGIASIRFNWRSQSRGEKVDMTNMAPQKQDMADAIKLALAHAHIDADRVILAGKSFGSIVALDAFKATPDALGAILLTPVCEPPMDLDTLYPDVQTTDRPVAVILGDNDWLCPVPSYYGQTTTANANLKTMMVSGDHGFVPPGIEGESAATHPATLENVDAITAMAVYWIKTILANNP